MLRKLIQVRLNGYPQTESIVKCAKAFSSTPTFELWGSDECPAGWSAAYTGLSMGAHYLHTKANRKCVDNVNFDGSLPNANTALWYATQLQDNVNLDGAAFPEQTYVQCAVCMQD